MWLPDSLYASLPIIYAGAALLTLYYTDSSVGYFSGILLLATSGLVWGLRREYRKTKANKSKMANRTTRK